LCDFVFYENHYKLEKKVKVKRHYLKNTQTVEYTGIWNSTYDEKTKQWNKVERDKQ